MCDNIDKRVEHIQHIFTILALQWDFGFSNKKCAPITWNTFSEFVCHRTTPVLASLALSLLFVNIYPCDLQVGQQLGCMWKVRLTLPQDIPSGCCLCRGF